MTLGRVEEVLYEVEADALRDYRPETFKYVLETLNEIRQRLELPQSIGAVLQRDTHEHDGPCSVCGDQG
jgi:hypothetical protein